MIYIPNFIKTGSGIQKLIGGVHGHRQHGDRINLFSFLQNKESRLTIDLKDTKREDVNTIRMAQDRLQ
jgi:hypothetical protein